MHASARVLAEIFIRTASIYLVILIGVRLSGKREVGQMTPFDLTLLLLLSNAVQNAMTGPDTSLTGGVVAGGAAALSMRLDAPVLARLCVIGACCSFSTAKAVPGTWLTSRPAPTARPATGSWSETSS